MKTYLYIIMSDDCDINELSPAVISDTIIEKDQYQYSLYAFTDKSSFDKEFQRTRNMNIFVRKTVDLSKEEIERFKNDNSEYLLEMDTFYTGTINERGEYETILVPFLATTLESDIVHEQKEDLMEYEIVESLTPFTLELILNQAFNKELMDILDETLFFSELYKISMPLEVYTDVCCIVDELQMFIHIFNNTINI